MFYVHRYQVEPENSEVLFEEPFTEENLSKNWELSGGEWSVQNGVLVGRSRENRGALIYTKQQFPGNVMLDFYGTMLPPCNNDLNFSWRAEGWDYEKNDAATGYIGGIGGWWTGRTGIEKYPECDLFTLTNSLVPVSGKEYHIQAGTINNMCFVVVDDCVIVEMRDPEPINQPNCNRIGLGTYCSQVQFRDLKVVTPKFKQVTWSYTPEF